MPNGSFEDWWDKDFLSVLSVFAHSKRSETTRSALFGISAEENTPSGRLERVCGRIVDKLVGLSVGGTNS